MNNFSSGTSLNAQQEIKIYTISYNSNVRDDDENIVFGLG